MNEIFKNESPNSAMPHSGERFSIGHSKQTELEHYHRYYFARNYVRGKDVLDIASGEGYGSAMLAQTAKSVIGVDVSQDAVEHAKVAYQKSNLTYLLGDACKIPLPDSSVDVVTSFETLEHFYQHDLFMQEVKRILRPNGYLILSTTDRNIYSAPGIDANHYHVNELNKEEFIGLIQRHFKKMIVLSQRVMIGSMVVSDSPEKTPPGFFEHRNFPFVEYSENISRAPYLLCVASDVILPEVKDTYLLDNVAISPLYERCHQLQIENENKAQELSRIHHEYESKINAIYSSFSWKITKVVRTFSNILSRWKSKDCISNNA